MGPEPLPRGQYPVSMLFVIIIQVDGMRQGTLYIAFSQWSPKGETIHIDSSGLIESGPQGRQGSLNPRECVSEGFDRK